MKTVSIQAYGAFRKFLPSGHLTVTLDKAVCTVAQVKQLIQLALSQQVAEFNDVHLVHESALATDSRILTDEDVISEFENLSILPPVCGG